MTPALIEVTTARGTMPVHITRPDADGPRPLVILYMDAPGVRGDLFAAARRLADAGYAAALPDLYYALGPSERPDPAALAQGDESQRERMMAAAHGMDDREVVADTEALLDRLHDETAIDASGWACVGFCMGGRFGMRAAERFGEPLQAASLLHPSRLVTDAPDSPHRAVATIQGELYLGFGESDHVTPVSTIPPLREELERHNVPYGIEVFPAAEHGYTMPHSPAYNREAAERAWEGTLALLARRLPPNA
jgi:carboxymethylenebutenolidase